MGSKLLDLRDTNALANEIMHDIADVNQMERTIPTELSSADLYRIDCAILSSLRSNQDFSRDLLQQLESGKFEVVSKPPKSFDDNVKQIQEDSILNITLPLEKMFDEIMSFISAETV